MPVSQESRFWYFSFLWASPSVLCATSHLHQRSVYNDEMYVSALTMGDVVPKAGRQATGLGPKYAHTNALALLWTDFIESETYCFAFSMVYTPSPCRSRQQSWEITLSSLTCGFNSLFHLRFSNIIGHMDTKTHYYLNISNDTLFMSQLLKLRIADTTKTRISMNIDSVKWMRSLSSAALGYHVLLAAF